LLEKYIERNSRGGFWKLKKIFFLKFNAGWYCLDFIGDKRKWGKGQQTIKINFSESLKNPNPVDVIIDGEKKFSTILRKRGRFSFPDQTFHFPSGNQSFVIT
jgi:hypothetical protein